MPSPYLQQVLNALWPAALSASQGVWCILDGARDARIYRAIAGCLEQHCCLYSGDLPADLQLTAPYLVELSKDGRFTRYLINQGWGNSWGIFLRSSADLASLRRHFRRFLVVRDERGKRLLLRYFDPRVLRVYLPTCVTRELETVFGPVGAYLTEDGQPSAACEFRFADGQLVQTVLPLAGAAAASGT